MVVFNTIDTLSVVDVLVFQSVRLIVNAETESLRKAKAVTSQIAQANRNKKKQDVTALVKVVVRLADKREYLSRCSTRDGLKSILILYSSI